MSDILKYESKIWEIANTLRSKGIVDQSVPEFMMPFFVLIMLDSRLVRSINEKKIEYIKAGVDEENFAELLKVELPYINELVIEKNLTFKKICENDLNFKENLDLYLKSFDDELITLLGVEQSENQLAFLNIKKYINDLNIKKILFSYCKQWSDIDLVDYNNSEITTLEEHIKNKWADISAGQHYTPQDIISLNKKIVARHFEENQKEVISLYDPTCGGGNMLFGIADRLKETHPNLVVKTYGQEFSDPLFALAKVESRFRNNSYIKMNDTLLRDEFEGIQFTYVVANPPFGTNWSEQAKDGIKDDQSGRFVYFPGEGDGILLFIQHNLHKMDNLNGFGLCVSSGSPLFSGDANSGESNIRKHILDNDYLEALIELPKDEFFNTNISTYIWVLNKNKKEQNKNKIKLINASEMYKKLTKSKGKKTVEISEAQQDQIVDLLFSNISTFNENEFCKVFDREYFYFNKQYVSLIHSDENNKTIENEFTIENIDTIYVNNVEYKVSYLKEQIINEKNNFINRLKLDEKLTKLVNIYNNNINKYIDKLNEQIYKYNNAKKQNGEFNIIINKLNEKHSIVSDLFDFTFEYDESNKLINSQLIKKDSNFKNQLDNLIEKEEIENMFEFKIEFNEKNLIINSSFEETIDFDNIFIKKIENKLYNIIENEYNKEIFNDNNDIIIKTKDDIKFYFDNKKNTIIKETSDSIEELGNGNLKVVFESIATKDLKEFNFEKVKVLVTKNIEKDYEVIPFQEIVDNQIVNNNIDDYLNKWIEKDYEKLENLIGVEINFNKIFYKYEKLRNVNDIFQEIKQLELEELALNNIIFDLTPLELSDEELSELNQ